MDAVMPLHTVQYLDAEITEAVVTTFVPRYGMTVDGYTTKRGAPTQYKVRIANVWRRVYVWQFSNAATCFVRFMGLPLVLRDSQMDRIKYLVA